MNKVIVRFSMAASAAVGVILSGCSKPEDAPAEEAAAARAAQPQSAAVTEQAAPSMMDSAKSAMTEGAAEAKQMTAEAAAMQEKQAAAMQEKAAVLVEQYAPQLDMLKTGATSIKALIDQNAASLPAGVKEKYQEFNTLIPELTQLVNSLKNYQGADLASLATKAQTDFAKAKTLYAEIKGLLPAGSI